MVKDPVEVLISAEQIAERTGEIARQILADYGQEPLILVGVLKGSFLFVADLARHMPSHVRIDFVQVSSYGGEKSSSGVVQIRKDLDFSIEGQHVLIVEDIVDTGLTLSHLRRLLATRNPLSLRVATLLSKPAALQHHEALDYVGFEIGNEFVVGYGLDYGERYRSLPYVARLLETI